MPVFESTFSAKIGKDGSLIGEMAKGTTGKTQYWPFKAWPGQSYRFTVSKPARYNISGRWELAITRPNKTIRPAMAEWVQKGNKVTGTILTPSGDYRYLDGVVNRDSLLMSVFDGSHTYLFRALIKDNNSISEGVFYSGIAGVEEWKAKRNNDYVLPDVGNTPEMKAGYTHLDFRFLDVDSIPVSITDDRFKNKVVIVQLMGSWCPNCMDETKFLSEYYQKGKNEGVEIVAIAYENSTDFKRSQISVRKFQQRFNVKYPMLISGVSVTDSLRTEKTIPQLTTIKVYPTTIYIGKDGTVRKLHSGFYGPGTGEHFEAFKKEFYQTIADMLKE
ncbi:MAG: TlpA family protein disulfide reductase [Chitinophagaceae bacterium]|nr:TlpA family protein disulfide reductase [Chitinophagaceae bacterium]